jgi:hypothetical protein
MRLLAIRSTRECIIKVEGKRTSRSIPVINAASSLARKQHALATSAGVEGRRSGMVSTKAALFSSVSGFPRKRCVLFFIRKYA